MRNFKNYYFLTTSFLFLFAIRGRISPSASRTTGVRMFASNWNMSSLYIPDKQEIAVIKKHHPPAIMPIVLFFVNVYPSFLNLSAAIFSAMYAANTNK